MIRDALESITCVVVIAVMIMLGITLYKNNFAGDDTETVVCKEYKNT